MLTMPPPHPRRRPGDRAAPRAAGAASVPDGGSRHRPACGPAGGAGGAGDLGRGGGVEGHAEDAGAAHHDLLELAGIVEHETKGNAEALPERPCDEPRARGGAHQGEGRQVDPHRARRRPLADDEVELRALHGGIEDFRHRRRQAVDLVYEEHVPGLQVGEERRQVAGALDHRAGRRVKSDPHLPRHDLRERGLAEARRPVEQHVIEGLAPRPRRLHEDAEVLPGLALPHELVEAQGTERRLARVLGARLRRHHPRAGHRTSSLRLARNSASNLASPPSVRAAPATALKASLRGYPRLTRAETASAVMPPSGVALPGSAAAGPSAMPPTLSLSSITMRWASFCPTPSARISAALSWAITAVA